MDSFKPRTPSLFSKSLIRLRLALPAVVLGTLFNVLDTVSTGLLLFPSEERSGPNQFKALQIQGLSMYIMSTVLSQVAMTMGGSHFPGALGAMLIEILPFLRGVASDIRNALGSENPALVPTVMVAYALTSFLTGFVFIFLGLFKLGYFVAYFPHTVLTGAIGAVGLSLFILGLDLIVPEPSSTSNISAWIILPNLSQLSLLTASLLPALFLSASKRSQILNHWTRGAVHNAYFIPGCLCSIPVIFWIIVGFMHTSQERLITQGWLFRVEAQDSGMGMSWNYWRELDFPKVEWWALRNATTNIVLLVTIGVLNLPIFVPALAVSLDVSYDMNHEFLGQGAANLLAGMAGTVPNILQYSYSVFVTRAKGGRFEMALVTILTFLLFFTSSFLLPYVPTVLASALVLFLGIELLLEAVWESAQTLVLLEWGVVVCTLLACTLFGFAEGFGVGIGTAVMVYLLYGVIDAEAQVMPWEEWNETYRNHHQEHVIPIPISPLNHSPSPVTLMSCYIHSRTPDVENAPSLVQNRADDVLLKTNARVIVLSGYVFFASIPSLETKILEAEICTSFVIVDLTLVHRLETAAAQCFNRAARELAPRSTILVLCGVKRGNGVHADFERAGVRLVFNNEETIESAKGILSFETRDDSIAWCQRKHENTVPVTGKGSIKGSETGTPNGDIYRAFCRLFHFNLDLVLQRDVPSDDDTASSTDSLPDSASDVDRFIAAGARFTRYAPGQTITRTGSDRIVFIIEGQADVVTASLTSSRLPLCRVLMMVPREGLHLLKRKLFCRLRPAHTVTAGDVLECGPVAEEPISVLARSFCVAVEIQGEQVTDALIGWARNKVGAKTRW